MILGACIYQICNFMPFKPVWFQSREQLQLFGLFFLPCFGFMCACERICVFICIYMHVQMRLYSYCLFFSGSKCKSYSSPFLSYFLLFLGLGGTFGFSKLLRGMVLKSVLFWGTLGVNKNIFCQPQGTNEEIFIKTNQFFPLKLLLLCSTSLHTVIFTVCLIVKKCVETWVTYFQKLIILLPLLAKLSITDEWQHPNLGIPSVMLFVT